MDRSFPALFSRNNENGANTKALKQAAEEIGFEGKDILEYVKEQQKLDRGESSVERRKEESRRGRRKEKS